MMNRRRFLTISAAGLAIPARAEPVRWQGTALGAEATLTIHAPTALAKKAIHAVREEIANGDALFSLFNPASALSRLNANGTIHDPAPDFIALMNLTAAIHRSTRGSFDPTIQPVWNALSSAGDSAAARRLVGWERVAVSTDAVTVAPGQQLSLNGIAQGYITDRVAGRLRALGLSKVLVNIGEFAALGGPWHLGIADPEHGITGTRILHDRAIATSSAKATLVGGHSHILDPAKQQDPLWSTVSVEADSAAMADALSTAFCLKPLAGIRETLLQLPGRIDVLLTGFDGRTLQI